MNYELTKVFFLKTVEVLTDEKIYKVSAGDQKFESENFSKYRSTHAKGRWAKAPVVVSRAGMVLNRILHGEVSHLAIDENDGRAFAIQDGIVMYQANGMWHTSSDDGVHLSTIAVADALSKNEELMQTFKTAKEEYTETGFVKDGTMALFCDSFYYGYVIEYGMKEVSYRTSDDAITKEGIESMLNMGHIKNLLSDNKANSTTSKPIVGEVREKALNGEYLLDLSEYVKGDVPPLSKLESFIPNKVFDTLVPYVYRVFSEIKEILDKGEKLPRRLLRPLNILFIGRPSSGKDETAEAICSALGLPLVTQQGKADAESDSFEKRTVLSDSGFAYADSPFLSVVDNGGVVDFQEINYYPTDILAGALNSVCEAPYQITTIDGEVHQRNPFSIILGTMNMDLDGTMPLNQALCSRFSSNTYVFDDISEKDFVAILTNDGYDAKASKWVFDTYTSLRNYVLGINGDQQANALGLRGCFGLLDHIHAGESGIDALNHSLASILYALDTDIANDVFEHWLPNIKDFRL